jgi:hypothetical protein
MGPDECITHAYAGWLRSSPQLQILRSVVISYTVAMMHGLAVQQIPAKKILSDKNVLEHIGMLPCSRMIGNSHDHIPGLVAGAAYFSCLDAPLLHTFLDRHEGHRR